MTIAREVVSRLTVRRRGDPKYREGCPLEVTDQRIQAAASRRDDDHEVQRLKANATGIEYRRTRDGRFFLGMIVHHFAPPGTFP
jgi:hypothetical protein